MERKTWLQSWSRPDLKREQRSAETHRMEMRECNREREGEEKAHSVVCSPPQYEAQVQLLKEELSRKEAAAQRRVERVQRECQALRSELKSHISDKQRVQDELEQLRYMELKHPLN